MKEELISLKIAELAKKKGFDWDVLHSYRNGQLDFEDYYEGTIEEMYFNANGENRTKFKEVISAPSQALLQRWLREKHNIELWVQPVTPDLPEYKSYKEYEYIYIGFNNNNNIGGFSGATLGHSYEQALEKGLFEALKMIKK